MSLEILPVHGRRGLARFVALPWSLYDRQRYPQWVPPLRAMVKDGLDARGNPFYRNAERALFMAYKGGRPVGRIAAIHNRRHNEFHQDRVGFFGFFEAMDDPEVAQRLMESAAAWLAARGLERIRGPVSPSLNDECGLLIEGFEPPPTFLTPWNPPYYAKLMDAAGLEKVKDLLGFWVSWEHGPPLPERFTRAIDRVRRRAGITFRTLDFGNFKRDVELAWDVYNGAWESNWGFVPMTRPEFDHMAGMLKLLAVPEYGGFAEVDGEVAGFALGLPDYNVTIKRIPGGRLLPFGLPMLLRDKTRLRTGRAVLLGVKERFRRHNIYFLLLHYLLTRGHELGFTGAEASWILEDNDAMLGFFREGDIPPYKRWRIYERAITPA